MAVYWVRLDVRELRGSGARRFRGLQSTKLTFVIIHGYELKKTLAAYLLEERLTLGTLYFTVCACHVLLLGTRKRPISEVIMSFPVIKSMIH